MTRPSPPLVLLLLLLAVGGPSPSPAHALPDNQRSYSFAYAVDEPEYKNFQDREEARLGQETRGRFRVALPDNRLQTVTYRAGSNGYTASISYDHHPSFEALREAVGPIGSAPEIGESILDGIRRGENWSHHKELKEEKRPQLVSSLSGHGIGSNLVNVTPTRTRPTPTRTRPIPTRTRPAPTRTRPTPSRTRTRLTPTRTQVTPTRTQITPAHTSRATTSPRIRTRPSRTERPTRNRVTAASSPTTVRGSQRPSPRPSARPSPRPSSASTFTEEANSEDSAILNRLINAIQEKLAAENVEDEHDADAGPPHAKKYIIADRESVRKRLEGIVHKYK